MRFKRLCHGVSDVLFSLFSRSFCCCAFFITIWKGFPGHSWDELSMLGLPGILGSNTGIVVGRTRLDLIVSNPLAFHSQRCYALFCKEKKNVVHWRLHGYFVSRVEIFPLLCSHLVLWHHSQPFVSTSLQSGCDPWRVEALRRENFCWCEFPQHGKTFTGSTGLVKAILITVLVKDITQDSPARCR